MIKKLLFGVGLTGIIMASYWISNQAMLHMIIKQQAVENEHRNADSNQGEDENHHRKNRLANEKSPYLLQHANNPVDWYPWGEEAFKKARRENKPIFLSIGYSTCHWCHVMEHESFENEDIADMMNKHFVSIKVDREERPDVDAVYMPAVIKMTGSGGWPMSVFMTAEGEPFAGGTYFPPFSRWGRPGFKETLLQISDAWENDQNSLRASAQRMTQVLQEGNDIQRSASDQADIKILEKSFGAYQRNYDSKYGGFGRSPKFPSAHNLSYLLRYAKRFDEPAAADIVVKTLEQMAQGGIFDHVAGGFHRYSTDQQWMVPHFEKMLYDQAIMARAYVEAYQVTKNELFAATARSVLDYVLREMRDSQGGFYSAEDADSLPPELAESMSVDGHQSGMKKEGAFYLWTLSEIRHVLPKDQADVVSYVYGLKSGGNISNDPHGEFGSKNILHQDKTLEQAVQHFQRSIEGIKEDLTKAKEVLYSIRAQRPRPHLDDKILTDWNGLMISTLAFTGRVLDEKRYKTAAEQGAKFILKNCVDKQGRLLHRYREQEAAIPGFLDDYAFMIHGLLDVYQSSFKSGYLREAKRLSDEMIRLFWSQEKGLFHLTGNDAEKLLVRQVETYDGAYPSGNSIAALTLIKSSRLLMNDEYEEHAYQVLNGLAKNMRFQPQGHGQFLTALDFAVGPSLEMVITADKITPKVEEVFGLLNNQFIPHHVLLFKPSDEGQAREIVSLNKFLNNQKQLFDDMTVYICENFRCLKPTNKLSEIQHMLTEYQ